MSNNETVSPRPAHQINRHLQHVMLGFARRSAETLLFQPEPHAPCPSFHSPVRLSAALAATYNDIRCLGKAGPLVVSYTKCLLDYIRP